MTNISWFQFQKSKTGSLHWYKVRNPTLISCLAVLPIYTSSRQLYHSFGFVSIHLMNVSTIITLLLIDN